MEKKMNNKINEVKEYNKEFMVRCFQVHFMRLFISRNTPK